MPNILPMQHALVLDACVLMSGVLRPWLLQLATDGWFQPIWSEKIGHEWRRNAARIWAVEPDKLEQAWQEMQQQHPGANMPDPQENQAWSPPTVQYSDPKDWHVILSAAQARTQYENVSVLTWNLKDFQKTELKRLHLQVTDPDRLLCQWWQQDAEHLITRLQQTIDDLVQSNRRHAAPLDDFLRRERLYRLARLYQGKQQAAHA